MQQACLHHTNSADDFGLHSPWQQLQQVQLCGQMCIYVSADEAMEAGAKVGVCSTSNEKAVQKIVDVMLDPKVASQIRVFAGDIVAHKKPDPAIYYLAAQELGVEPSRLSFTDDPLP